MEIFKNENCILTFDEKANLLVQTWAGYATFEKLKSLLIKP
jgi:hypothetical protein